MLNTSSPVTTQGSSNGSWALPIHGQVGFTIPDDAQGSHQAWPAPPAEPGTLWLRVASPATPLLSAKSKSESTGEAFPPCPSPVEPGQVRKGHQELTNTERKCQPWGQPREMLPCPRLAGLREPFEGQDTVGNILEPHRWSESSSTRWEQPLCCLSLAVPMAEAAVTVGKSPGLGTGGTE